MVTVPGAASGPTFCSTRRTRRPVSILLTASLAAIGIGVQQVQASTAPVQRARLSTGNIPRFHTRSQRWVPSVLRAHFQYFGKSLRETAISKFSRIPELWQAADFSMTLRHLRCGMQRAHKRVRQRPVYAPDASGN